jgi:hypothetical protein
MGVAATIPSPMGHWMLSTDTHLRLSSNTEKVATGHGAQVLSVVEVPARHSSPGGHVLIVHVLHVAVLSTVLNINNEELLKSLQVMHRESSRDEPSKKPCPGGHVLYVLKAHFAVPIVPFHLPLGHAPQLESEVVIPDLDTDARFNCSPSGHEVWVQLFLHVGTS